MLFYPIKNILIDVDISLVSIFSRYRSPFFPVSEEYLFLGCESVFSR